VQDIEFRAHKTSDTSTPLLPYELVQ
jgi:hypothetical protein